MAGLQTAKKELRRNMRDVLQRIPAESIVSQSKTATIKLFSLAEYQHAKRIGVYLSMPSGELSTTAIVQDALSKGKEVFVPYIHSVESPSPSPTQKKMSIMDMLALESMEEFTSLVPDKWGIPSLSETQVTNKKNCLGGIGVSKGGTIRDDIHGLDMIVMPGMAFDEGFRRLGHGKGYYDHFLSRYAEAAAATTTKMPLLVALSLREQLVAEVPVTTHDWRVDALIVGDNRCLVRQED
ncbi:5-formyltetrahydrofolate cyclo-ligase [Aspergillus terreus]|uniref:5-formyltetrahydrofolate cyclo-ligase n=1 Tax=Aspergillus terreus TaxID=33178 RepID=A0A5M3Z9S2_ASPTE|nr:hypothetical protein ATETN484_0010009100 [Aspergillus terreus]GFF18141.1 5-formyltetrahydrofolate cyclo-ligase [Aspergillus terreus]